MFFIGLFGTNFKVESAGYLQHEGCPCCGEKAPLHLARKYQYFHAFFVPLFKFGSAYYATCPTCASVFEVSDALGKNAEQNGTAKAYDTDLHLMQNNYRPACPQCAALLGAHDRFCRNCGRPVE